MKGFININSYDEQQIFDYIVEQLLEQGARAYQQNRENNAPEGSLFNTPGCMYRTGSGLMCAVGQILSEDEHQLIARTTGANSFSVKELEQLFGTELDQYHRLLLQDLQFAHDSATSFDTEIWKRQFSTNAIEVAERHRLNPGNLVADYTV